MFNLCAASLSPASSCRRTGRNQALYRQRRASNAEDAGDAKADDEDAEDDEGEDAESTALFSKVYVPLLHAAGGNLTPPQVDKLQADFVQAAPRDPQLFDRVVRKVRLNWYNALCAGFRALPKDVAFDANLKEDILQQRRPQPNFDETRLKRCFRSVLAQFDPETAADSNYPYVPAFYQNLLLSRSTLGDRDYRTLAEPPQTCVAARVLRAMRSGESEDRGGGGGGGGAAAGAAAAAAGAAAAAAAGASIIAAITVRQSPTMHSSIRKRRARGKDLRQRQRARWTRVTMTMTQLCRDLPKSQGMKLRLRRRGRPAVPRSHQIPGSGRSHSCSTTPMTNTVRRKAQKRPLPEKNFLR